MVIFHKLDSFITNIFPNTQKEDGSLDKDLLIIRAEDYFQIDGQKPKVSIEGDIVKIEINVDRVQTNKREFDRAVKLCTEGKLQDAKKLLHELIEKDNTQSDYYRLLGQVYSDLGDHKEGVNQLIDALCWDPNNKWALVMMGNIFSKYKNDIETALKYYNQAVKVDPENNIILNNIGAVLVEKGMNEKAIEYFEKAKELDPNYPNTHYALGLTAQNAKKYHKAFEHFVDAIKTSAKGSQMYNVSVSGAIEACSSIINSEDIEDLIISYKNKLELSTGKDVVLKTDSDIPTTAKLELAENYKRAYHLVLHKPQAVAKEHLIMHELVHLDLISEARKTKENYLFISNGKMKEQFMRNIEKDLIALSKKGIEDESIAILVDDLFSGLNRQILNTPIDLFIEDFLHDDFPQLRPFQFISLFSLNREGKEAVTNKKVLNLIPKFVLRVSKIYNLINAMHLKEIYGVDLVQDMEPSREELTTATKLYKEYLEYRGDKEPGEEYELVENWAKDLSVDYFFSLILEHEYRKDEDETVEFKQEQKGTKDPEQLMREMEYDPNFFFKDDPRKKEEMDTFLKAHEGQDINMAVVMYMVGAIQRYSNVSKAELQKVAFEIATIGINGIDPNGSGYSVASIPGITFTGYHLLAYYYVTWKLFNPELHKKLQLPFDKEYELAQHLAK
ncbi:hypothetical protein [Microcystis phage Mwe-JY31]